LAATFGVVALAATLTVTGVLSRRALAVNGIAVDIVPPEAVDSVEDYDAVILGSAVYTGRWLAPARDFAIRFRDPLATRPVWLFSSAPVGDPSRKLVQSMEEDPADVTRIGQADTPIGSPGRDDARGQLSAACLVRHLRCRGRGGG
jgi:hypothetical protein